MLLLERHMGKVAKQSELLVRSSRESAKAMHELGQGLQGTYARLNLLMMMLIRTFVLC